MSSLFIAGSGFDIAHGIPTQYSEFRPFIIQKYPEALKTVCSNFFQTRKCSFSVLITQELYRNYMG